MTARWPVPLSDIIEFQVTSGHLLLLERIRLPNVGVMIVYEDKDEWGLPPKKP